MKSIFTYCSKLLTLKTQQNQAYSSSINPLRLAVTLIFSSKIFYRKYYMESPETYL